MIRWRRVVPAALLVLVAGTQWIRTAVTPQSPWIGAGFGMFATVDGADRVAILRDPETGAVVGTADFSDPEYGPAIRVPSAHALAEILDRAQPPTGDGLRLEVVAPEFDPSTGTVTWRVVESVP